MWSVPIKLSEEYTKNIDKKTEDDFLSEDKSSQFFDFDNSFDFNSLSTESIKKINSSLDEKLGMEISIKEEMEQTRSQIWKVFVRWSLLFFFLTFVIVMIYNILVSIATGNYEVLDLANILPIIWTILWTPLGMIIWYYFKWKE